MHRPRAARGPRGLEAQSALTTPSHAPGTLTRIARDTSLGALLSLLMLLIAWYGWLAPPALSFGPVLLILFLLPLLLPLTGMVKGRPRAFIGASLLALVYLSHGVMEAYGSPAERWLALVEVTLSLMLFAAGLTFARLRRREMDER